MWHVCNSVLVGPSNMLHFCTKSVADWEESGQGAESAFNGATTGRREDGKEETPDGLP